MYVGCVYTIAFVPLSVTIAFVPFYSSIIDAALSASFTTFGAQSINHEMRVIVGGEAN